MHLTKENGILLKF